MDKNAVLYMVKNQSTEPHIFMDSDGYICVYTIFLRRITDNTKCSCYYHNGTYLREKELIHYNGFNIHYYKNNALVHTLSSSINIVKYRVSINNISNRIKRTSDLCHIEYPCCLDSLYFLCDNCHITTKKYIWKHLCARINILATYADLIDDIRCYAANILAALYVREYNK